MLAILGCGLIAAPAASAKQPAEPRIRYARLERACAPAQPGSATCYAVVRRTVAAGTPAAAGIHAYTVGAGASSFGPAGGLTPALLSSAYSYDPTGGSGQTVGIVDAYDDPKIEEDLAAFDSHYGLGECSKANGCFKKVNQEGSEAAKTLPAKDKTGWSQEISLDVETVRAVCQACKILLVETKSPEYTNLAAGVNEAVALGATEISNSYGGPEEGIGAAERAAYNHPGIVITAATGDDGWDDWNFRPQLPGMPNAPSSLPSVISVGGTSLELRADGTRALERVWNNDEISNFNNLPPGYVTGGGCSTLSKADLWQRDSSGFAATGCGFKRLAADVSADADPFTGFDIYDNFNYCGTGPGCKEVQEGIEEHAGWQTFGGTSLSAPMIASMYALAGGSGGLRYPALSLYGHLGEAASLYDVTAGGNGYCDGEPASVCGMPHTEFGEALDCEGTTACDAAAGLDGPTGVGTPVGLGAFKPLLPTAAITAPATFVAGTSIAFSSAGSRDPYPGGAITGWSWNWGDGTPDSHEASPAHTYAAAGQYTVSLTVIDSYGLSSVTSAQPAQVLLSEAEVKKKQEEEAAVKKKQEEAAERLAEEESLKRQEEANRQQEAAKKQEEEAKKKQEEEAAAKKHEEERPAIGPGIQGTAGFQALLAPPIPDAELAGTTLVVSASGTVSVKVSCPIAESSCMGTLTLRTLSAISARLAAAPKDKAAILTLASASFDVPGGKLTAIRLRLSSKARALLTRERTLRARATLIAHDTAGNAHTGQAIVTLRAVKRGHHRP